MQDERDALFGNERRTRIILLLLAFLCVGILALVAGYLFLGLSFDPYSPGRFHW
jgi:type VI protein secretion system component VasF